MGQFSNSIHQVAKNYGKYDAWEQNQADICAQKEALYKNKVLSKEEKDEFNKRAETVLRATEIMDSRSEDNCENMEQFTGIVASLPLFGIALLNVPILNLVNKKVDLKYQPKIDEVTQKLRQATDLDTAEKITKELNQINLRYKASSKRANIITSIAFVAAPLIIGILTILWGNKKQKEASRIGRFQAKQDELRGLENFVVYTPEQIRQAEEIAMRIPDEKERKNIAKMISELKAIYRDKFAYKAWLAKKDPHELEKLKALQYTPEELAKGTNDKELIVNTVKEINIKAEEYSENLENAYDTVMVFSAAISAALGFGINKILKVFKVSPKINTFVSLFTPLAVTLGIGMKGTVEQKKAARIGRYHARKDILANPAMLHAFSEEEMESVKNIKAKEQKKSFFQRIGQSFKFLGTYHKDKKEYEKYKKTVQVQNEKLQKAFKEINITDKQKADAKALQTNVFRAFDEVDEMSQRYSEDIEAGCEIAKQTASSIWSLSWIGLSAWATLAFFKGKFPISKIVNKISNLTLSKDSSLKKSVNNLYEVLNKKDKKVMHNFQRALVNGDLNKFIEKAENAEIKAAFEPLQEEIKNLSLEGITQGAVNNEGSTIAVRNAMNKHFKQGKIAKWVRNLTGDILKLKAKSSAEKNGIELTKEMQEELGLNFNYKNYKTLINTGIVGGVPILGVILGVPYAFNAWLTNIQKKAGKIGVMQAVETLDDPRIFAENGVNIKSC